MPINNDAAFRYKIIDRCLRNNMRRWSKQDLLQAINHALTEKYGWNDGRTRMEIKERQLNYDLKTLEFEYGAPVERYREGKQHFYRYTDCSFSIEKLPVSEEDLQLLGQAVHLMQQMKGFNLSDEFAAIVHRLENRFKLGNRKEKQIISFENPPEAMGTENLGDIFESILKKKVLKIVYKPFKAPNSQEHIIHPYYLKEYNNRWFLFGWNDGRSRIENLALDRIRTIKVTNVTYRSNDCFHADEFFGDIIGVTRLQDAQPEKVIVKLGAERAPYLLSKPLHHSQHTDKMYVDGSAKLSYRLIINKELETTLLSFGPHLEILEPVSLRQSVKLLLEKSLEPYLKDN